MARRWWLGVLRVSPGCLLLLVALVTLGIWARPWLERELHLHLLHRYVDRPLLELPEEERASFLRSWHHLVPEPGGPHDEEASYLWRVTGSDRRSYLLLFARDAQLSLPGSTCARVTLLDARGRLCTRAVFTTGCQLDLVGVSIRDAPARPYTCLQLDMRLQTAGPGGPETVLRQLYAVTGGEIAHIRTETVDGNLVVQRDCAVGPPSPLRSPEEWEGALDSGDPVEVLRTLTWLRGVHGLERAPSGEGWTARTGSIRQLARWPRVPALLEELATHSDPWIRDLVRE